MKRILHGSARESALFFYGIHISTSRTRKEVVVKLTTWMSVACVVTWASIVCAGTSPESQSIEYGLASWPEDGLGNHRALVKVQVPSDAVYVSVPWRRPDPEYDTIGIRVVDETTGMQIKNASWYNVTRENVDVVFQPDTIPGEYGIYFMPYTHKMKYVQHKWRGSYYGPGVFADQQWLDRNDLPRGGDPSGYFLKFVGHPDYVGDTLQIRPTRSNGIAIGSSFWVVGQYGHDDFLGNNYELSYGLRCREKVDHPAPSVSMSLLRKDGVNDTYWDSLSYDVKLSIKNGQLNATAHHVHYRNGVGSDNRQLHQTASSGGPVRWRWQAAAGVTCRIQVHVAKTVISLRIEGVDAARNRYVYERVWEDADDDRLADGWVPRFILPRSPHGPNVWIEDFRVAGIHDNSTYCDAGPHPREDCSLPDFSSMDQAELVAMQSRGEFQRFHPMLTVASRDEMDSLYERYADEQILFFPEDRRNVITMLDHLPQKWAVQGPADSFAGKAQPGEYYVYQVGVYGAMMGIEDIDVRCSDLVDGNTVTVVPEEDITCFNKGGVDPYGQYFDKVFAVGQGKVRPLWIGMRLPDDFIGKLSGSITMTVSDDITKTIPVSIDVSGKVVPHSGDDDHWRMSRLRWLNKHDMGNDVTHVPAPYTPVQIQDDTITILNRTITLNKQAFPVAIASNDVQLLAAPVQLIVDRNEDQTMWQPVSYECIENNPSRVHVRSIGQTDNIRMTSNVITEFDGTITCEVQLECDQKHTCEDISIIVPVRKELARYLVGFGHQGGKRPANVNWKWSKAVDNGVWVGRVVAGLGMKLLGDSDKFFLRELDPKAFSSWYNDGQGGGWVREHENKVIITAYTGPTQIAPKRPLRLRFQLFVTPFKPLKRTHWDDRFTFTGEGNVYHYHHSAWENQWINYPFLTADRLAETARQRRVRGERVTYYFGTVEISNRASELFALRSLGDEMIDQSVDIFTIDPASQDVWKDAYKGHPWLPEHMGYGYREDWHTTTHGEVDVGINTGIFNEPTRYYNYWLNGVAWMKRHVGDAGLFNDSLYYPRSIVLRLARILSRDNPNYLLPAHCTDFSRRDTSAIVVYMGHLSLVTELIIGEVYDFRKGPEYWLIETSGLPFGLDNKYLPNPYPDYPYRQMLFAATGCHSGFSPQIKAMFDFWDQWGIQDSEMIGWWDDHCPVRTSHDDILATVYRKGNKVLVVLASWADEDVDVLLTVDWKTLGVSPDSVKAVVPTIGTLQPERVLQLDGTISIAKSGGLIISIESQ